MPLEDYYEKRKAAQVGEATELVQNYRQVYGREPDEEAMSEFFWLFSNDIDLERMPPRWRHQMRQAGNEDFSLEKLKQNEKQWTDMWAFFDSID